MDGNKEKRGAITAAAHDLGDALDEMRDAAERQAKASTIAAARLERFVALWREMLAEPEQP